MKSQSASRRVLTGTYFAQGNWACAEGAIVAGCRFFAGYPITPASEIIERMSQRLPEVGGAFVQFEDELASMAAVVGASYAGTKAMTATSGPGLSLMAENIGLAVMTEAPCVVVDVMRGGPSTGQPTRSAQGDVMQCRWLSHGDYEIIALAPWSVQEMFDLTVEAFNLAERYRVPVLLMADQWIGHMRERLVIPEAGSVHTEERRRARGSPKAYQPFAYDQDLVPAMACFGDGYRFYANSLTHDERGYPDMSAEAQQRLVARLCDKIGQSAADIVKLETCYTDDAETLIVAYGTVARVAVGAMERARAAGQRVGLLRLVTLWPFPTQTLRELSRQVRLMLVPEMNYGQLVREVEAAARHCQVRSLPRLGWVPHRADELLEALGQVARPEN